MDRAALLAAVAAFDKPQQIEWWPGFFVKELTALDAGRVNIALKARPDPDEIPGIVYNAASVVCNEAGELCFDVRSREDLFVLAALGIARLTKIVEIANTMNGDAPEAEPGKA